MLVRENAGHPGIGNFYHWLGGLDWPVGEEQDVGRSHIAMRQIFVAQMTKGGGDLPKDLQLPRLPIAFDWPLAAARAIGRGGDGMSARFEVHRRRHGRDRLARLDWRRRRNRRRAQAVRMDLVEFLAISSHH